MAQEERIFFDAGAIRLAGCFTLKGRAPVVVCHPHPLYGGDRNNNVVMAIARGAQAAGHSTLRFDFRGGGGSGGTHGGGEDEVQDIAAALSEALRLSGQSRAIVAGYSFGAHVAINYLRSPQAVSPEFWIGVAPPFDMYPFTGWPAMPALVLVGDRDAFCPQAVFERVAGSLPAGSESRIIGGAGHFFGGHEKRIEEEVAAWLSPIRPGSRGAGTAV